MQPNDFKLRAISGSNCHTIQTKFFPRKELSPRKYLNVPLQIFKVCHLQCYSFLSVTFSFSMMENKLVGQYMNCRIPPSEKLRFSRWMITEN
jgi:hypothetical protein